MNKGGTQRKSALHASKMLADYEKMNADLPEATRRQLAVFVLEPRVGKAALEELFKRPLGQTPRRHRSWLWYNAMVASGMSHLWDDFCAQHNDGICMHHCLMWLQQEATPEEWALLSKRLGVELKSGKGVLLNPYWWKHYPHTPRSAYWTKGGIWDVRNNFTKIIVLGESLDAIRDHGYSAISRALTRADTAQIERELHNTFDPDEMLAPDAINGAVEYVRRRIPDILGYERELSSYKTASWFFQTQVPHPDGGFVLWTREANYPMRETDGKDINWFPKQ